MKSPTAVVITLALAAVASAAPLQRTAVTAVNTIAQVSESRHCHPTPV
jgi:hypothetical protein